MRHTILALSPSSASTRPLLVRLEAVERISRKRLPPCRYLDTSPFLQAHYPLEEYERAWNAVRSRTHIKVMLKIDATAS